MAEVERVLSVLDGAVMVISAVEGVRSQTRVLMRTSAPPRIGPRRGGAWATYGRIRDELAAQTRTAFAQGSAYLMEGEIPAEHNPLNQQEYLAHVTRRRR